MTYSVNLSQPPAQTYPYVSATNVVSACDRFPIEGDSVATFFGLYPAGHAVASNSFSTLPNVLTWQTYSTVGIVAALPSMGATSTSASAIALPWLASLIALEGSTLGTLRVQNAASGYDQTVNVIAANINAGTTTYRNHSLAYTHYAKGGAGGTSTLYSAGVLLSDGTTDESVPADLGIPWATAQADLGLAAGATDFVLYTYSPYLQMTLPAIAASTTTGWPGGNGYLPQQTDSTMVPALGVENTGGGGGGGNVYPQLGGPGFGGGTPPTSIGGNGGGITKAAFGPLRSYAFRVPRGRRLPSG